MDSPSTLDQARAVLAGLSAFNVGSERTFADTEGGQVPEFSMGAKNSYKHGYWKNQNGDIVIGGMWANEYMEQSQRGWTPLRQYGSFDVYSNNIAFNADPFRLLLERGGAKEFPLSQIREMGWHRKLPFPGLHFPQLDGVENTDVQCGHCGRWFLTTQNLSTHESVMHTAISQNQGLSRVLVNALGKSAEKQNEPMIGFLTVMAEQMDRQATTTAALIEQMNQQAKVTAMLLERLMTPVESATSVAAGKK